MPTQSYPIPRFHFQVDWGGTKISFSEVTGLVMEREKIEYRHSDSLDFNKLSMPGLVKLTHIILKRGKFESDADFDTWFNSVSNNRSENRRDVTIRLLNEQHEPVASWTVLRCFPVKLTAPDLKSDANETAIESIEIAHEGFRAIPL
jgi:phage tail-like protein